VCFPGKSEGDSLHGFSGILVGEWGGWWGDWVDLGLGGSWGIMQNDLARGDVFLGKWWLEPGLNWRLDGGNAGRRDSFYTRG
jgi:hypothetical protein